MKGNVIINQPKFQEVQYDINDKLAINTLNGKPVIRAYHEVLVQLKLNKDDLKKLISVSRKVLKDM